MARRNVKNQWLTLLALFLLIFAMYRRVLDIFFLGDDGGWIYLSIQSIRKPGTLLQTVGAGYRPLMFPFIYIEHALFGLRPAYYHAVSLFLHVCNAALFFAFAHIMMKHLKEPRALEISASASLLFSFLFMNYETLFWISLAHDILNAFFYLSSILLFLKFHASGKARHYAASLFAFVLCLMSKEIGVTVPFCLSLYLLVILHEKRWKLHALLIPYIALSFVALLPVFAAGGWQNKSLTLSTFDIILTHFQEAAFSFLGFSGNEALQALIPRSSFFQLFNIAKFLLLCFAAALFFQWMYRIKKDRVIRSRSLKAAVFLVGWMLFTFFPYAYMVPDLSRWSWSTFSPGYHYFYLSSLGFPLFVCFAMMSISESEQRTRLRDMKLNVLFIVLVLFVNILPLQIMQNVYVYHGEVLRYLLKTIQTNAAEQQNASALILLDFPEDYIYTHGHGLPKYIQLMGLPYNEQTIVWAKSKNIPILENNAIILHFETPFSIRHAAPAH